MGRAVNSEGEVGLPVRGVSRDEQAHLKYTLEDVSGLELAVLVGSARRGAAEIVVSGVPVELLGSIEAQLEEVVDREVTVWTLEGFARDAAAYQRMLKEGIPLVEKSALWQQLRAEG